MADGADFDFGSPAGAAPPADFGAPAPGTCFVEIFALIPNQLFHLFLKFTFL